MATPTRRRNWRLVYPLNIRHATELCKEYALERHNLSVERIAERMGLENHWIIYKWIENGRIPALLIPTYEHVCGVDFISRWLASAGNKLLIEIPKGRKAGPAEMQVLQEVVNTAIGGLLQFYQGNATAATVMASLQTAMEGMAWHQINVKKSHQPELPLGEEA